MSRLIRLAAIVLCLFLNSCSVLEDDETLIDMVNEHAKDLAPIAKIIWDEGEDGKVDLRGGEMRASTGRELEIEPESLVGKLTNKQIETLADADVRIAHRDTFYGGVLFITGESGIGISGAVTGLIWKGDKFNQELVVDNVQEAVKKENKQGKNTSFEFIRPVNDEWGIFYEAH